MTEHDAGTTGGEAAGSVAEEAAKLLGALRGWAADAGAEHAGEAAQGLGEHVDDHVGHGQDCRYCPVCIAINKVRQLSPDVREHLADAVGSLAEAVTAALRQPPAEDRTREPTTSPVRIDLDDD